MKEFLIKVRKEKGLSQKDVAEAAEINQAAYSNIEKGKRNPSVKTAKKIAAVLGFDWIEFFKES